MVLKMTQSFTRSMHTVGVSVGPTKRSVSESKLPVGEHKQRSPNQPCRETSTASSYESSAVEDVSLDDIHLQEEKLDDDTEPEGITSPIPPPVTKMDGPAPGLIEISLAHGDDIHDAPSPSDLEAIDELLECAKDGNLPLFQHLCAGLARRHISPDCAGYMGWTPAHWAARHGHVHILEYLLANHVNLDVLDKKGDSLLHKAAANGQFRGCQWLLQHGFNVQARNNNGQTPLDIAQQVVALSKSTEAQLCETILARENAHTF